MATYTKEQAKERLRQTDAMITNNDNYRLITASYVGYFQKTADSLERRIKRGDFDTPEEWAASRSNGVNLYRPLTGKPFDHNFAKRLKSQIIRTTAPARTTASGRMLSVRRATSQSAIDPKRTSILISPADTYQKSLFIVGTVNHFNGIPTGANGCQCCIQFLLRNCGFKVSHDGSSLP
jgi:hypothetical protein